MAATKWSKASYKVILYGGPKDGQELAVTRDVMQVRELRCTQIRSPGNILVYRWDGTVREDGAYRFRLERTDR